MSNISYLSVSESSEGQRLDNYLIKNLKGVPKSHIYRIIRSGEVRINKKRATPHTKLNIGDIVRLPPLRQNEPAATGSISNNLKSTLEQSILFEDAALIVINKPAGIAVHGGSGMSLGVIEAFRKMRPNLSYLELVHRLDKETSGCLLLAKKRTILRDIQSLLVARTVIKVYQALLCHTWTHPPTQYVQLPLQKNILKSGERMVCIHPEGKPAYTEFKLIRNFKEMCLVQALPKTGRTHQIRVHAASLGHPIVGDKKYTYKNVINPMVNINDRLYLHASKIQFNLNGKTYLFEAELDKSFLARLKNLNVRNSSDHE